MKLTQKQKNFADYYIELGSVEQAAIKAGYSPAYARGNAHKLVANVSIKKYLEERMTEIKSERIVDQEEIMAFLTSVIRGEVLEPVLVLDGGGTQRIEMLPPPVSVRKSAAVDAGKRYSMWTDKQEIDVKGAVSFIDDISGDAE